MATVPMRDTVTLILLAGGLLWGCAAPDGPDRSPDPAGAPDLPAAEARETPAPAEVAEPGDRGCAARDHRALIGRPLDAIETASLPHPLRVYRAGNRVAGDYRPERLNLVLGPDGRVAKVRCG